MIFLKNQPRGCHPLIDGTNELLIRRGRITSYTAARHTADDDACIQGRLPCRMPHAQRAAGGTPSYGRGTSSSAIAIPRNTKGQSQHTATRAAATYGCIRG